MRAIISSVLLLPNCNIFLPYNWDNPTEAYELLWLGIDIHQRGPSSSVTCSKQYNGESLKVRGAHMSLFCLSFSNWSQNKSKSTLYSMFFLMMPENEKPSFYHLFFFFFFFFFLGGGGGGVLFFFFFMFGGRKKKTDK